MGSVGVSAGGSGMKVMKIPVAITRTAKLEEPEPPSEALRIALRIAGYASLIGACAAFWGGLIASYWLGLDVAYEGFSIFVALFVLGWLCFMNRYGD
jgi:hypothetical protein